MTKLEKLFAQTQNFSHIHYLGKMFERLSRSRFEGIIYRDSEGRKKRDPSIPRHVDERYSRGSLLVRLRTKSGDGGGDLSAQLEWRLSSFLPSKSVLGRTKTGPRLPGDESTSGMTTRPGSRKDLLRSTDGWGGSGTGTNGKRSSSLSKWKKLNYFNYILFRNTRITLVLVNDIDLCSYKKIFRSMI